MTSIWKTLITLTALVYYLPIMHPQMGFKNISFWKILVTLTAFIWFLPCVCLHMYYENTLIWSKEPYHTGYIDMASPQCVSADVYEISYTKALSLWRHWYGFSLVGVLIHFLRSVFYLWEKSISNKAFYMCYATTFMRISLLILTPSIWLLPSMFTCCDMIKYWIILRLIIK